jgi:glycosyltransferase involved in cell wall biosynthesis
VIPVHNGERYLAAAIRSVLAQTYRPIEVIVVDDGSTDSSASIARSFEAVRCMVQAHQGVAVARNTGISAAGGAFIAFLDADDVWPPDKLAVQVGHLMDHPRVAYTVGRIRNFLEPGIALDPKIQRTLLERDQVGLMTLVGRREVFAQVGGFDPSYRVGEDFDWFVRAKDAGIVMAILPDVVLHRRIHGANLSSHTEACRESLLRVFKASLDRQRADRSGPHQ